MFVMHKSFGDKNFSVVNPSHIPRKGDKVDMGFTPAPEVKEVLYQFKNIDVETLLDITVIVD
jgi:hypothetical protein